MQIIVGVKAIIIHKGKLLIIQRSNNDFAGGTWECPGGKIEFGEQLEEAVIREVQEEVSIDISVQKLLYASTFQTHQDRQMVLLTYLCNCENNVVTLSDEHTSFKWADKKELYSFLPTNILEDFEKNDIFSLKIIS